MTEKKSTKSKHFANSSSVQNHMSNITKVLKDQIEIEEKERQPLLVTGMTRLKKKKNRKQTTTTKMLSNILLVNVNIFQKNRYKTQGWTSWL